MSTPETTTRELAALDDALAGRRVDPDLADLAELAVALRDDRPDPDPGFARELDARVERGFPRARGAKRIKWPRLSGPALGLAASALIVVGIGVSVPLGSDEMDAGGGDATVQRSEEAPGAGGGGASGAASGEPSGGGAGSDDSSGGGSAAREPAPGRSAADDAAAGGTGGATAADDPAGAPAPAPAPGSAPPSPAIGPLPIPPADPGADGRRRRSVERSATVVLATPPRDIDRAAAEILRVTDDLGGYVVSSTVSSGSSGQFELRVPERRLQTALSRLSRVARVRERTQSAVDITGAVVSVRERLKDARTERRSLLRQLADATTPNETASIRARLRLVSGQIAAAKRDLAQVRTRAARSTIAVTLLADRRAAAGGGEEEGGGWTPGDALDDAVRILEVAAGVVLVALALLLPLALLALPAWLLARQAAQRRRERALDAV